MEYLDYDGLARYDGKIKRHIHNEDVKRVDVDDVISFDEIDEIVSGN